MGQTMLYDLNLAWSPATSRDQLLQLLTMSASLGYGTVALNHALTSAPPADHVSPIPDPSSLTTTTTTTESSKADTGGLASSRARLPAILHRATITIADPGSTTFRLPVLSRAYDLVAVRPLTADAFQNACLTLDVPIISLDMTQQFPFHFRPKPCMAAVSRGVRFEICYGQVVGGAGAGAGKTVSPPDAKSRAAFIANVTQLVRATRGRGIIVSSEARNPLGLRAPADVINLLSVWGLASERGMEALRSGPRSVVVNEALKKTGYKGVVNVVRLAEGGSGGGNTDSDTKEKASQGQQVAGKKAKKQKRKNGEGAEPVQPGEVRQNKKVKLVSREGKKSDG